MKTFLTGLYVAIFSITYCQQVSVDQSFGNKGFVITPADSADLIGLAGAAALQPDGKILISSSGLNRLELIRYMPNGTVDLSFGRNGSVAIDAIKTTIYNDITMVMKPTYGEITGIAVQPDGKIVVAGNAQPFFVARFLPDGKPDNDFGDKGFFSNQEFSGWNKVYGMVLQPDGKIILTGGKPSEDWGFDNGVLLRLNANGSIDKSFAKEGKYQNENDPTIENTSAALNTAAALQQDGKIVTAGAQSESMYGGLNYAISRYNANGFPDSTFGNSGNVITKLHHYRDDPTSIAVQPDGKIVVGGSCALNRDTRAMIALRYNANGSLDRSFGRKGKVTILFNERWVRPCKALLQPNGKIILTGSVYSKETEEDDFAICIINKDGTIDRSFGIKGKQVLATKESNEFFQTALLQPDGKIVLIGYSWYNQHLTAVMARCNVVE